MNLKNESIQCFNCEEQLNLTANSKVLKNDECPSCYADLHSCKMCNFYDIKSYNECRETNADRIVEKEKSNYCDYFTLGDHKRSQDSNSDTLSAANSLFKN